MRMFDFSPFSLSSATFGGNRCPNVINFVLQTETKMLRNLQSESFLQNFLVSCSYLPILPIFPNVFYAENILFLLNELFDKKLVNKFKHFNA